MKNQELSRQITKLEGLFDKTSSLSGDVELAAHWARYLCVQCAGLLENSILELYGSYSKLRSDVTVNNYVESKLKRVKNPKAKTFLEITSNFKLSWHNDLEEYLLEDGRKEAIDGIMNNRHQIAHGGNSAITVVRVKEYFQKSVEVLVYIENQLS